MIKIYMIIRCLLAILPFTLLAIAAMGNNLPKVIRCRQLFMPVISLAYCFGITYVLEKLMKVVMWVLEMAKRYIPFLEDVNWSYWILLITNVVVLLLYFPVKKLILLLLKHTWKYYEGPMRKWKLGFYYFDEDLNQWVLK